MVSLVPSVDALESWISLHVNTLKNAFKENAATVASKEFSKVNKLIKV